MSTHENSNQEVISLLPVLGHLPGSLLVPAPGGHLLAEVQQVVKVLPERHLIPILQQVSLCTASMLCCVCWHRAGSFSAIYNIHLSHCHPDIPKLFWPPLSRPVPHILCLLLTLHTTLLLHSKPVSHSKSIVCVCELPKCIAAFLFLSQHSPPRIQHLPRQGA